MRHRHIEIGIDKLVLEGFVVEDGNRIRASVEQELTRLFVDRGLPQGMLENVNIADLAGKPIGIEPGAGAAPAGRQVARAIYGAIKR